jgi:hypothetical protein
MEIATHEAKTRNNMSGSVSDALVFFGATGDLQCLLTQTGMPMAYPGVPVFFESADGWWKRSTPGSVSRRRSRS